VAEPEGGHGMSTQPVAETPTYFKPFVDDACKVLEYLLLDARDLEFIARLIDTAFWQLTFEERGAISEKHPELARGLLMLNNWVSRHGVSD